MLATTPPPVKPQPRVYAVPPEDEASARIAACRLRKPTSISGVMAVEALEATRGGRLGAGRLQRKTVVELFSSAQPTVCTDQELST